MKIQILLGLFLLSAQPVYATDSPSKNEIANEAQRQDISANKDASWGTGVNQSANQGAKAAVTKDQNPPAEAAKTTEAPKSQNIAGADDKEVPAISGLPKEEMEKELHKYETAAGILPYNNNYILFHSALVVFQISFTYKIVVPKQRPSEPAGLFLAYTQHSYWKPGSGDIGDNEPYIYSNFQPDIYYLFPYEKNHIDGIQVGFFHESDGLGKQFDPLHREWDRYYVQPTFYFFNRHLKIRERVWYPDVPSNYNPDIVKYMGYTETNISTDILAKHWVPRVEVTFYKGSAGSLNNLSFMFETHFSIFSHDSWKVTSPVNLYTQWYDGYGEALRTYNKRTDHFKIGMSALF